MRYVLILCLALLTGCSTVGTKEGFALCKAADAASTIAVLGKGGAEKNPIMGYFVAKWGYAGLIGASLAMVALVYWLVEGREDEPVVQAALTAGNAVTCGIAVRNYTVFEGMK